MPKKKLRFSTRSIVSRTTFLTVLILVAANIILGRLFFIQVRDHKQWVLKAASQQQTPISLLPERGEILWRGKDGTLQPAATNTHAPTIWAVPKEVKNPQEASALLSRLLDVPKETIVTKLSKPNDPYESIAKQTSAKIADEIKNLNIAGIYIGQEPIRFYPSQTLASHVLGFVSEDKDGFKSGRYGIETYYEDVLRGKAGQGYGRQDARGKFLFGTNRVRPEAGASIILTIDPNIQFEAERLLADSMKKWKAKSGTVIAMEPKTGRILALANAPTFDPNEFRRVEDFEVFLNRSVSFRFEPGSVFKPFTMAAGLEYGKVTAETTYYDSGELRVGGYTIRNAGDAAPKKQVTMTRVLERSYNIGAAFVADKVGPDLMRQFLLNTFGFETKTGIDLPSEQTADFRNLKPPEGRPVNFATAAFGQGIALTPLKLLQAFNVFANGGYLVRPHVVDEIQYPNGKKQVKETQLMRKVVSQNTLASLTPMLESVVAGEHGSGKLAQIKGYRIAGKTGTGEIPLEHGRGYSDRVNHSFIGFGPVSDSRVIILVRLEEPIGARYAEATAVPVFRDLMKFILNYYGIPPDKPVADAP